MASSNYLAQFRAAHCELLECMAVMERVTVEVHPNALELTLARFRISRASLIRRTLWHRIFKDLSPWADLRDAATLRDLNRADMRLLRESSARVGRWTSETILHDWLGYCDASRGIRSSMRASISAEQRLLYPMLERYERRSPRAAA